MIISYSDLGSVNMHDLLLAKSNLSLILLLIREMLVNMSLFLMTKKLVYSLRESNLAKIVEVCCRV